MESDDKLPIMSDIPRSFGSIDNFNRIQSIPSNRKSIPDSSLFSSLAKKLRYHKELFGYRRFLATSSLVFGLIGLSLSIALTEISIHFYDPSEHQLLEIFLIKLVLKSIISLSTIILIIIVLLYHKIDIKIQMQRHNLKDWILTFNTKRIFKVFLEITLCSLHPFPNFYKLSYRMTPFTYQRYLSVNNTIVNSTYYTDRRYINEHSRIYLFDGVLTILMFSRMYLLARVLILRSNLYHDASAQSYSAINRTALNTKFIFKSWMNLFSGYVLTVLIFLIFICGSWSLRVCEIYETTTWMTFSDSMWLAAVTFLSIGYGDVVPTASCGKTVAITIGALGAGCTALLVAIIASKLELSQSEKYLHNFVQDSELNQRVRNISANIVKYAWKLYVANQQRRRRKTSIVDMANQNSSLQYKRRLFSFVRQIQLVRLERRHLSDNTLSLFDVHRSQLESRQFVETLNDQISQIEMRLHRISDKLNI